MIWKTKKSYAVVTLVAAALLAQGCATVSSPEGQATIAVLKEVKTGNRIVDGILSIVGSVGESVAKAELAAQQAAAKVELAQSNILKATRKAEEAERALQSVTSASRKAKLEKEAAAARKAAKLAEKQAEANRNFVKRKKLQVSFEKTLAGIAEALTDGEEDKAYELMDKADSLYEQMFEVDSDYDEGAKEKFENAIGTAFQAKEEGDDATFEKHMEIAGKYYARLFLSDLDEDDEYEAYDFESDEDETDDEDDEDEA